MMVRTAYKSGRLLTLLAVGAVLFGCAQQPAQPTSDNAPKPSATGGEGVAQTLPAIAPWLLFPETTGLDDDTFDLWMQSEDRIAEQGVSDSDVDLAMGDQGDEAQADQNDNADANQADENVADAGSDDNADLWDRIRHGFELPDTQNRRIQVEADWFGRHQAYLDRVAERAQPYLHYIVNQVQKRGMPSEIALLPVVESAFQPYAYSSGRAAGIWQFIPSTGRRYGLKLNWWYDGRRDIVASTRAALDYLQYLHDTFDGDWLLALAAYNSGEGTVQKAIRHNRRRHRPTDYWSLRLPRETEQYVPRLLALREIVADPQQQGINLRPIADEPYLTAVQIDSQLDLATAAKLAGMDLEDLHNLNPGFNRWATSPDGPHRLLLPLDKAPAFTANVAKLPPEDRVHWVRHRIRNGETLGGIASHYHTTTKVLADLNKLHGHFIRAGHYLIIPMTSGKDPVHLAVRHIYIPKEVASADEKIIHIVHSGDSLWTVAQRYGTTVKKICHWNGISRRKMLHPGQKLVVGLGHTTAARSSNIIPASMHMLAAPEEVSKPRKITYTVRRGDSLSRISHRFRVTIQQVRKWNDIKRNERIQPGQRLTLYVPLIADAERG